MKKNIVLVMVFSAFFLASCGSNPTTANPSTSPTETTETSAPLKDEDFIVNLATGLEKRWDISNTEKNTTFKTLSDKQTFYRNCVNAELDTIGVLSEYSLENHELQILAQKYIDSLNMQYNAIETFPDIENVNKEWTLAKCNRSILISDFANSYGLSVAPKYNDSFNRIIQYAPTAKKIADITNWIDGIQLDFQEDTEQTSTYYKYYKAILENPTDYNLSSLTISLDLLDEAGIVVDQPRIYLSNISAGGKYYVEFSTSKKFSDKKISISYDE